MATRKTARIVFSHEAAMRLAAEFCFASKWFECEPLPDDEFRFVLKDEPGIDECVTKAGVTVLKVARARPLVGAGRQPDRHSTKERK